VSVMGAAGLVIGESQNPPTGAAQFDHFTQPRWAVQPATGSRIVAGCTKFAAGGVWRGINRFCGGGGGRLDAAAEAEEAGLLCEL
jgi:hypothetical protein